VAHGAPSLDGRSFRHFIDDRPSMMQGRADGSPLDMAQEPVSTKRTRSPGDRARARIAAQAAELATIEGLDGLTIGRLAEATGVPKSSVHALFGSKEELQLATIKAARDSFIAEVVSPALTGTDPGRERLVALCEGYLSYVE